MNERKKFDAVIGLVVLGCAVTGVVSLFTAVIATFDYRPDHANQALLAAALAFGLLANAVLRQ